MYVKSRARMNEIAHGISPFFYGPPSYEDHHGGGLWLKDDDGWFLVRNVAGIEWSAQFCADPAKVDQLRINARRLYAGFPEAVDELGIRELLDTPIVDADGVERWTDSICNASVPLPENVHRGVLPRAGGIHHYPAPVAEIAFFKFDDFDLWVEDDEGTEVAVVPVARRGSGDGRVRVLHVRRPQARAGAEETRGRHARTADDDRGEGVRRAVPQDRARRDRRVGPVAERVPAELMVLQRGARTEIEEGSMTGFDEPTVVDVEQVNDVEWRLLTKIGYTGKTQRFEVPVGSNTDFASVPRMFVWLLPRYGRYTKAAILHDHLWRVAVPAGELSLRDADGILRRALRELGVTFLRRWLMWAAVRYGALKKGGPTADWLQGVPAGPVGLDRGHAVRASPGTGRASGHGGVQDRRGDRLALLEGGRVPRSEARDAAVNEASQPAVAVVQDVAVTPSR